MEVGGGGGCDEIECVMRWVDYDRRMMMMITRRMLGDDDYEDDDDDCEDDGESSESCLRSSLSALAF